MNLCYRQGRSSLPDIPVEDDNDHYAAIRESSISAPYYSPPATRESGDSLISDYTGTEEQHQESTRRPPDGANRASKGYTLRPPMPRPHMTQVEKTTSKCARQRNFYYFDVEN